jgi:hypothetical protein
VRLSPPAARSASARPTRFATTRTSWPVPWRTGCADMVVNLTLAAVRLLNGRRAVVGGARAPDEAARLAHARRQRYNITRTVRPAPNLRPLDERRNSGGTLGRGSGLGESDRALIGLQRLGDRWQAVACGSQGQAACAAARQRGVSARGTSGLIVSACLATARTAVLLGRQRAGGQSQPCCG